jgi:hypothetical protein
MAMSKKLQLLAIALACSVLASAPTRADDGARPSNPKSYNSPTDEYVPPARMAPRAQRTTQTRRVARRAPLTAYIRALPSYVPPSPSDIAPGSGPLTYSYMPAPSQPPVYTYVPNGPTDFDGAPCPSRPSQALAPLFECTLR